MTSCRLSKEADQLSASAKRHFRLRRTAILYSRLHTRGLLEFVNTSHDVDNCVGNYGGRIENSALVLPSVLPCGISMASSWTNAGRVPGNAIEKAQYMAWHMRDLRVAIQTPLPEDSCDLGDELSSCKLSVEASQKSDLPKCTHGDLLQRRSFTDLSVAPVELHSLSVVTQDEEQGGHVITEPKRPPSAFFLFADHCKRVGKPEGINSEWSGLTVQEKKPFEDLAGEMKAIYEVQVADWNEYGRHDGRMLSEDYVQQHLSQFSFNSPSSQTLTQENLVAFQECCMKLLAKYTPEGGNEAVTSEIRFVFEAALEDAGFMSEAFLPALTKIGDFAKEKTGQTLTMDMLNKMFNAVFQELYKRYP